jgi:hypothetical protein
MIPATPEPKIPENGPEPEFRPEFRRIFEPSYLLIDHFQICGMWLSWIVILLTICTNFSTNHTQHPIGVFISFGRALSELGDITL